MSTRRTLNYALGALCWLLGFFTSASTRAEALAVDRAVASFTAPEMGGVAWPRFVWQRELAFLARLEALADTAFAPEGGKPYLERHVRAALERVIAETVLASFDIDPNPTSEELKQRAMGARLIAAERIGGMTALTASAVQEGMADGELWRIFQRQARASLYLDRMVAPMLEPSEAELRTVYQAGGTPFSDQPFEQIEPVMRRWYVGRRLAGAVSAFYESARGRIHVKLLSSEGAPAGAPVQRGLGAP
ncbi:MAG TPA: hypothetical protein VL137_04795 [Polyangiaceae bacterium]|nr:hypothetical protein [Polyangiaceae bacterium]